MKKDESDDGTMKTKNRIPPPGIIEVLDALVVNVPAVQLGQNRREIG